MYGGQDQSDVATEELTRLDIIPLVQALLQQSSEEARFGRLRYADIVLDRPRRCVYRGETPIELTPTEFSLLEYFLANPEVILSKEALLEYVWQHNFGGNTNIVATYVHYLRKKLDAHGPPLIRTARPAGYVLDATSH